MFQKLIEEGKKLSEARKNRDSRHDDLQNEYLQFNGFVKDVWSEHKLPKKVYKVDDVEFTLVCSGCTFVGGFITKSILNKLMQQVFEYLVEIEKSYDDQFTE